MRSAFHYSLFIYRLAFEDSLRYQRGDLLSLSRLNAGTYRKDVGLWAPRIA